MFGGYVVDDDRRTFVLTPHGAADPHLIGTEVLRHVTFDGELAIFNTHRRHRSTGSTSRRTSRGVGSRRGSRDQAAHHWLLDSLAWVELARRQATRIAPIQSGFDLATLIDPVHHDELGRLVADARGAVPLRDDNGAVTGAWPMGLLRRAMLEAGRRIGLTDAALAVEATVDELTAHLSGGWELTHAEMVARRAERAVRSSADAPASLGPVFALPPLRALPRPLALMGAAQIAIAEQMSGLVRSGSGPLRTPGGRSSSKTRRPRSP